jgi:ubiquinone/menaquinone biosynthesis C-methylase UbiE
VDTSEHIRAIYEDSYSSESRAWRNLGARDKAANIVRACDAARLPNRPRVVEIGSGDGAIAQELGNQGFFGSYLGFDLSRSGVAEARGRSIRDAEFTQTVGGAIPVADDGADLVVLSHVVEHLEHPRLLLYEARRIAPIVVVEVPLEHNARLPRDHVWDGVGHINKYTSTTIRQLVQTCELEIVSQFTTNPSKAVATFHADTPKRRAEWLLKDVAVRVAPRMARTLFTYHETILARRTPQSDPHT